MEFQTNSISVANFSYHFKKNKTKIIKRTKCGIVKGRDDDTYRGAKNINKTFLSVFNFRIIYSFRGSEISLKTILLFIIYFVATK